MNKKQLMNYFDSFVRLLIIILLLYIIFYYN